MLCSLKSAQRAARMLNATACALRAGVVQRKSLKDVGNDSNLLIVFYVQIMPDDFVMQLHRF